MNAPLKIDTFLAPPSFAERSSLRDAGMALALALVLSAAWAFAAWPQLSHLMLPDTDDMMRLAQIRDLLGGQAFNDWTQYRLGPPGGTPMHWSRLNDLVPAGIILALQPLFGRHAAELSAVIAWPGLLFAAYLWLSARIARRIGSAASAPVAVLLAAMAYPAISLFQPGRIDHHALQIVLMLTAVLALTKPPSIVNGATAGACAALSFGVGLETAPQVAALLGVLFACWVRDGTGEANRTVATGAGLLTVTLLLFGVARPTFWSAQWCDAFTPASVAAASGAGIVFVALGMASPRLAGWRVRLLVGGALGGAMLGAVLLLYPSCLTGPYGSIDPFVRRALIDNIVEAQSPFATRDVFGTTVPTLGLLVMAAVIVAWVWRRKPQRRNALLAPAAVLGVSLLVALVQLRGAYIGAALTAPVLAHLVVAARRTAWRTLALPASWIVCAGLMWLVIPPWIARAFGPPQSSATGRTGALPCRTPGVWQQLDRLPPGRFMAASDTSAYLIGGTMRQRAIGGPYHRNNAGNRALYDFFLAPADRARATGRRWRVDYVLVCPTDFGELDITRAYPASLGASLVAGRKPIWLRPIPLHDTGMRLYRVVG